MRKEIRSIYNCTPHVLAQCGCGWEEASSIDAKMARQQLFKHMRQNNCPEAHIEVGRSSKYKLFTN